VQNNIFLLKKKGICGPFRFIFPKPKNITNWPPDFHRLLINLPLFPPYTAAVVVAVKIQLDNLPPVLEQ